MKGKIRESGNIIIISGPTSSGKTRKAVELCKEKKGEIISCDSRQVYKYLDVGTNKKGVFLRDGVRDVDGILQYLTDIINPNQSYSAVSFVKDADLKILKILKNGKIPVIVGGSGLYIKALLYGLDEMPKANESLRRKLRAVSQFELYSKLLELDPKAAEKNRNNPQRLLRALEVNILSGKTMQELFRPKFPRYRFKHYSIFVENRILYDKINKKCKYMIENGMIEETIKILGMGFDKSSPVFSSIGYKHVIDYIDNKISKSKLIAEFSKDTRRYAKRQNTWFKSQPDVKFIRAHTKYFYLYEY
jgi:tRNA dimethylallyltransferase